MYILGIHDGHNSGASLSHDGVIIASVSEERLTRQKNAVGYPILAIEDCLKIAGIDSSQLSAVVYASLFMHAADYLTELERWYCVGIEDQRAAAAKPNTYQKLVFEERKEERIRVVSDHLGIDRNKVSFIEHHLAHLTAAHYTAPGMNRQTPVLGLTCDGSGDNICATVSVCRGTEISRIAKTDRHASLGKIYSRITMMMGMKPWEHEYKIMGMAPYADLDRADRAAEPLREILGLDPEKGMQFVQKTELSMNYAYRYLQSAFERIRFDTISGAVQLFTEEQLCAWVKACVQETGIRNIVAGGGVFMNVKANMLIAELDEVDSFYVMPSAGDESLSIGACLHHYYTTSGDVDFSQSCLQNLYLGGGYSAEEEMDAVAALHRDYGETVRIHEMDDPDDVTATKLAEGEIVARCRDRMEWGARALGNRSINARADDYRLVDILNQKIKQRDFWMPFAPSILEEEASRYIDDPKDLKPWFMTFTYRGNEASSHDLAAGSHPRDKTMRPQVVTNQANPGYHKVIAGVREKTGMGGVLNTSFNLHGEPIVYGPSDAVSVLMRSGLTHLALDRHFISKIS